MCDLSYEHHLSAHIFCSNCFKKLCIHYGVCFSDMLREVIERKPEEFKISCLKGIAELFPEGRNPFYCGFGNKINVSILCLQHMHESVIFLQL